MQKKKSGVTRIQFIKIPEIENNLDASARQLRASLFGAVEVKYYIAKRKGERKRA